MTGEVTLTEALFSGTDEKSHSKKIPSILDRATCVISPCARNDRRSRIESITIDFKKKHYFQAIKFQRLFYSHFVYITSNEYRTTLYIGITNNIQRRLSQHYFDSQNTKKSFAGKYNCIYLVYYEGFESPKNAIAREKELKKWRREKKNKLITSFNPKWETLNNQVV